MTVQFKVCKGVCKESLPIIGCNFYRKRNSRGMGVEGFNDTCIRCLGGRPRGKRITEEVWNTYERKKRRLT